MDKHHDFLTELEEYSREMKVSPATVCRAATGNPRLYGRLVTRIRQTQAQIDKIKAEMARQRSLREKSRSHGQGAQ
ncbi:hypothetical protein [Salipiger marinus]|uniref:hypothetical protein n=1 Tax=Salipiger marinus TaxID=555512 RepID=UPI000B7D6F35|nr:hypothetical protein [Salipiger marinus]